jgi:outer membrane protein OmpA-like peptidoglycan-associated protein
MGPLIWLLSGLAAAQAPPDSGFDAHGFVLAAHDADARDPLVVARPGRFGAQSWFAGGLFEYASQPLLFDTPEGEVVELDDVVALNASVGYAPHERVRLDVAAPLFFAAQGEEGPLGAGMGDIRASALLALVAPSEDDGGLGLGFVLHADVPTGRPEAYLGQYTVAGGVGIAATVETPRLTLSATASSELRPNTAPDERPAPTRGGDAFAWGTAVGYLVGERTGLTVEVHGEVPIDPAVRTALGSRAEALLSFRTVRQDGAFLTTGLGTALSRGAGSSPLRLVIGGGFGDPDGPFLDLDGDGIEDAEDACPEVPETMNGFKDEDGCRDALPTLTVHAAGPDGRRLDDAQVAVRGPIVQDGVGELVIAGDSVLPGTEWEVLARRGECLMGETTVTLGPGDLVVDVPLATVRSAELTLEVVDAEGQPVEGASARIQTEDSACAPSEPVLLDGGSAVVPLGPGAHRVIVSAPELSTVQEQLALEAEEGTSLKVTLQPTKVRVDAERIEILEKVYFDTGEATIQERSTGLLNEVAAVIVAESLTVAVHGHTDDRGAEDANLALSQARAEAVVAALVEAGVPAGQLTAEGFGEAEPRVPNTSKANREQNRRVEFLVVQPEADEPEEADEPVAPEDAE